MLRMCCFPSAQLVVEGWSPSLQSRHAFHELLVEVLQTLFVLLRRLREVQGLCWANSNSVSSLNFCLPSLNWFTTSDSLSLMAVSRPSSSSILFSIAPCSNAVRLWMLKPLQRRCEPSITLRYHETRTMIFVVTKQHLRQRECVGRMIKRAREVRKETTTVKRHNCKIPAHQIR